MFNVYLFCPFNLSHLFLLKQDLTCFIFIFLPCSRYDRNEVLCKHSKIITTDETLIYRFTSFCCPAFVSGKSAKPEESSIRSIVFETRTARLVLTTTLSLNICARFCSRANHASHAAVPFALLRHARCVALLLVETSGGPGTQPNSRTDKTRDAGVQAQANRRDTCASRVGCGEKRREEKLEEGATR